MQRSNVLQMDANVGHRPPVSIDLQKRLQAMELNLLGSISLSDVARALGGGYRKLLGLDMVSLLVFEREDRDVTLCGRSDDPTLHIVEHQCVTALTEGCRSGVWVGRYDEALHSRYFPRKTHCPPVTIALLPLSRRAKIIGVLALGLSDTNRQRSSLTMERLNRLAAIVAVAVENLYNQEHIRQVSLRDPLTGLYNRRYFSEHLQRVTALSLRGGWPLCCLFLDIDHFKEINDRFGHAAGDAVLCELGKRVVRQLRSGEVLARVGGEEFCVLLSEVSAAAGVLVAERIRRAIASTPFDLPEGDSAGITISCGVADISGMSGGDSEAVANGLLDRSDRALYLAKQQGRNRVVVDEG